MRCRADSAPLGGQLLYLAGYVGLGLEVGEQLLQLPLGLVASQSGKLLEALGAQTGGQQEDGRQVHLSVVEHVEQARETPTAAGRMDARRDA